MFTDTAPLRNTQHDLRHPRRFNEHTAIEDQLSPYQDSKRHSVSTDLSDAEGADQRQSKASGKMPARPSRNSPHIRSEDPILRSFLTHPAHSAHGPAHLLAYPPFDLTASVYIDGHEKPEARQVIYLNPNNTKYYAGGFVFKGRWVAPPPEQAGTDGTEAQISIRNWIFKAMPISVDDLTSRMAICSTEEDREAISDLDLDVDDLQTALSRETLDAGTRPRTGQIEVRIRRIIAGTGISTVPFRPYHYRGTDEIPDLSKGPVGDECTHTTTLRTQKDGKGLQEAVKLNTVPWKPYKKGEDVYVKFVFTYTDRAKLVKLGLCDEDGRPSLTDPEWAQEDLPKATTGTRKREEKRHEPEGRLAVRRKSGVQSSGHEKEL